MILEPGDVITTGTPPGVGMGMKPQRYLKAGDVVTLGIEGLGEQRQRFVAFEGTRPRHEPRPPGPARRLSFGSGTMVSGAGAPLIPARASA
jgi:hypothetical protein